MTKIEFDTDHQILLILSELPPLDDEFELWASIFLHHDLFSKHEFELGADRHLMRFIFKDQRFNLNFEHYSESIWVTADGIEAQALLPELYQYLQNS
ncbi:DUF3630 family protein [Pseudoalteromonas denitrificans]|uniref:DUF3630 domain-containing protein n=1 Tax=Pseudoalteromonas denitrificans DSM 6059 TaxID=1123010 RepID=A0A1I1J3X8_9GAMM|nr:DUF3630 family protein [Pseudoalteromonas denitrificans]SFC43267.1 Protein of unknown function [Pseudoalteromonas denitrificans DSM 6059]